MEDSSACSAALSFSEALSLYAFDGTFDLLTAWSPLSEWASLELVQLTSTDSKEQMPEETSTQHVQRRARAMKTRTRRRKPAVKQSRKRAKTEILDLQSQVAELESQVTQFKDTSTAPSSLSSAHEPGEWSLRAAEERQKLHEAQKLNARFKSALACEAQIRGALEAALQTMSHLQAESVELLVAD